MSGNFLSHNGPRRALAFLLTLALLMGSLGFAEMAAEPVFASEDSGSGESSAEELALAEVVDYYKSEQDAKLKDFWELLAIYGAGEELTDYVLPATKVITDKSLPSDYADVFITELIKGRLPDKELAMQLAQMLSVETGSFGYEMSNQQAWAIIALDLYNKNASDENKVAYDINKAIDYLMEFQENGNFFFNNENKDYPGEDSTGPAAIALAPYINSEFWPDDFNSDLLISALSYSRRNGESYGSADTAAFAILGYNALDIDKDSEDYQAAKMELISYQLPNGGFYFTYDDDISNANAMSTRHAAVALSEMVSDQSLFLSLQKNNVEYIGVNVMVQSADGMITRPVTATTETTVKEIVESLVTEADLENYNYYINGTEVNDDTTMEEGEQLVAVPNTINYIASISADKEDVVIGETVNISLSIIDLETGDEVSTVSGAVLTLDGESVHTFENDEPLKYEFNPDKAGEYTFSLVWPEGIIEYSDASYTLIAKELDQAVPVSVRVEGPHGNILYNDAFVVRGSQSLLTVFDAITQALTHSDVPFAATVNGFILSINHIENDDDILGYWLYTLNKEQYLNGSDWVLPTTQIQENDVIIVYYGMNASYPFVESELQPNGDVKLTFTSYQYDDDGYKVLLPIEELSVFWGMGTDKEYSTNTDENGVATIPREYAVEGSYTLQINKTDDYDMPLVIRLAPGYEITITSEGAGGNVPSTPGDTVPKVSIRVIGPDNETIFSKTSYTFYDGMTALDLLRRTGLSIKYNDSSKIYVSSIEGYEEFDYGPTSGWLYKVNNDESILSSAATYKLEAGDALVWFYTKDYTKESGSVKWEGTILPEETTGTVAKNAINSVLKDLEAGKADSWTVSLASGDISFDKDALAGLVDQMSGDSVDITIEQASNKDLSAKQRQAAGDRPVYDISITSGKKNISQFGGKLTISLPYTLKDGERPSGIVVYHLDAEGNLVPLEGTYNPATGKVVFIVDHLSYFVIGYDETLAKWPFTDVTENDWFYTPVKYAYERGIFSGTGAATFAPNSPLTRSMLVAVLARMSGADLSAYKEVSFNDVDINSWYGPSVAWAKEMGVVSGYANKGGSFSFKPDDRISRQDIAVMLNNYNEKIAKKAYGQKAPKLTFADHPQIAGYAKAAVESMQQAGIISGMKNQDGSFRFQPLSNATRAEAATMIYNMLVEKN
jgi:hypothetical protein